jgi:tetratricopeptide (TPR) repeat protein
MNEELGLRYYRLALSAAGRRDLTNAVVYARYACLLDPQHSDAAALLGLCLYELGESEAPRSADAPVIGEAQDITADALERVRSLMEQKKWRAAARAARAIPHQSVRILNIQGCIFAGAKRYALASDCFAKALAKDRGNRLAAEALAELAPRRKRFWGIL